MSVFVRQLREEDRPWARELLRERWASEIQIVNGEPRDTGLLEGFVAEEEGKPLGLATFEIRGAECELVTLDSLREGEGIASALVATVAKTAWQQGCARLRLMTTNDNTSALRFYQRRGFILTALHPGGIEKARELKPEIPKLGKNDIPIRDTIELALDLRKTQG